VVVEMLSGTNSSRPTRSIQFVVSDRKGGKMQVRPTFGTSSDASNIRSWQVLDNAIAVEVSGSGANSGTYIPGTVYLWRTVP